MALRLIVTNPDNPADDGKHLYKITDAMRLLSLSRGLIYELIRTGELRSVTIRRARRIPATALADFVTELERQAAQDEAQEAIR
jgi:excisionase family DNA binding protein